MKYAMIGALVLASAIGAMPAAAQGGKPVVAVAEFKNETNAGWWSGGVGWELSGMLSNELMSTGSFKVVERTQIESVLAEQNMAASGRITPGAGALGRAAPHSARFRRGAGACAGLLLSRRRVQHVPVRCRGQGALRRGAAGYSPGGQGADMLLGAGGAGETVDLTVGA